MTKVLTIDPERPDARIIAAAAGLLREGGIVAFPTETVYGLGAHALDVEAVRRVFAAKGRPPTHPLIVHTADTHGARSMVAEWPGLAARLASAFWPGPLTIILRRAVRVPDVVTGGLDTVGVRVPAHPVARALLRVADVPVAAPSANPYTGVSSTTAPHVLAGLEDRIDMILDAGPTPVGIESTVIDLTASPPRLLRPGTVSAPELRRVLGELDVTAPVMDELGPRPSPGLSARHYAPRATVRRLTERSDTDVGPVGAIVIDHTPEGVERIVRMPADPAGYSRRLYAALHELDAAGIETIYLEDVPPGEAWDAIRDRLRRAGAPPS